MISPNKLLLYTKALFSIRQASADLHAAMLHMPMSAGTVANDSLRMLSEIEKRLEQLLHEQAGT